MMDLQMFGWTQGAFLNMARRGMGRGSPSKGRNRMHFLWSDMEYDEYSMWAVMYMPSYEQGLGCMAT